MTKKKKNLPKILINFMKIHKKNWFQQGKRHSDQRIV